MNIAMKKRFLKIAVEEETKAKVNILAAVKRKDIYQLIGELVDAEWKKSKMTGLVSDTMLAPVPGLAEKGGSE